MAIYLLPTDKSGYVERSSKTLWATKRIRHQHQQQSPNTRCDLVSRLCRPVARDAVTAVGGSSGRRVCKLYPPLPT